MKKPVKYTLFTALGLLAIGALSVLLANRIFTTKLYLSCKGKEVTSIYVGSMIQPIKTIDKLEGVTIIATKYPFKDHTLMIETDTVFILSGSSDTRTVAIDTLFMGESEWKNENGEIFRNVSFNRLTRQIDIEGIYKDLRSGAHHGTKFKGVCTEVKAL